MVHQRLTVRPPICFKCSSLVTSVSLFAKATAAISASKSDGFLPWRERAATTLPKKWAATKSAGSISIWLSNPSIFGSTFSALGARKAPSKSSAALTAVVFISFWGSLAKKEVAADSPRRNAIRTSVSRQTIKSQPDGLPLCSVSADEYFSKNPVQFRRVPQRPGVVHYGFLLYPSNRQPRK